MSALLRRSHSLLIGRAAAVVTTSHHNVVVLSEPFKQRPSVQVTSTRNFSFTNMYVSMACSTPVAHLQQSLVQFHDATGLPWWATIIVSTIALRTVITLPLSIYQSKIMARIELIGVEIQQIAKDVQIEAMVAQKKFKWDDQTTRAVFNKSMRSQYRQRIERDNCHPAKSSIVLLGQIPLWICQSLALRNLLTMFPDRTSTTAQMVYAAMGTEGFGWMADLTLADGTLILPVTFGLLNLANIETLKLRKTTKKPSAFANGVTWVFRGLSVAMIYVATTVPSGLALFWTTSTAIALGQNVLLLSPKFKRLTGIPTNVKSHIENPYQYMAAKFMERIHDSRQRLFSKRN